MRLEQTLTKQQIFEDYANQIHLGWHGSFGINGFGEAAEAYFGKDIRQLSLPEAAMLAGIIQRPGYYNPYHHPDRVRDRRNVVLALMRQNGDIDDREYALAVESPLNLAKDATQSVDAPYFVDMVNEDLQNKFQDVDFQANSFRVYTTLDLDLQRAATEAIRAGMQGVDEQVRKQKRFKGEIPPEAQCALIALDPHTGEIKALSGGRNYGASQLNHIIAKRQPGSIFKPFVYTAALNTAIEGGTRILTAGTTVVDEPTTFWYDNKPYEPNNFKHEFYGTVTFRQALAKSMNVATVKVAEMVGYDAVVAMAKKAGLNYDIQPTPAVALGSYDVTPLEMAGAYTMFANEGVYVKPSFISAVRSQKGRTIFTNKPEERNVLDPRVAYLMTNLMEEVMRSGTAAGVRARGFTAPAAGKTGTSHDGWFAGYTSDLLCIVWVGFDDNRDARSGRRPLGAAYLGRLHEARPAIPRVSQRPAIRSAGRHRLDADRSAVRNASHAVLPHHHHGSLHLRDSARWLVPAARRRAARRDARGRMGNPRQSAGGPGCAPRGCSARRHRRSPDAILGPAGARRANRAGARKTERKKEPFPQAAGCV